MSKAFGSMSGLKVLLLGGLCLLSGVHPCVPVIWNFEHAWLMPDAFAEEREIRGAGLESEHADPVEHSRGVLEQINFDIATREARLEALVEAVKKTDGTLAALRAQVIRARADRDAINKELDQIERERLRLKSEIEANQRERLHIEEAYRARMRALYGSTRAGSVEGMFARLTLGGSQPGRGLGDDTGRMQRGAVYLAALRRFDLELTQQLVGLRQKIAERGTQLDQLVLAREKARASMSQRERELSTRLSEQQVAVLRLKEQKNEVEGAVTALRAQGLRLETVMTSMTGGAGLEEPVSDAGVPQAQPTPVKPEEVLLAYKGKGLQGQRGSLRVPIVARILRGFGRHQVAGFRDAVFTKGIEFLAQPGAPVAAIADGRVIFSGSMPLYGPVIIIDHGERWYSLYGKIVSALAARGSSVTAGAPLGLLGASELGRPNFYFEIRHMGQPLDPQKLYPNALNVTSPRRPGIER